MQGLKILYFIEPYRQQGFVVSIFFDVVFSGQAPGARRKEFHETRNGHANMFITRWCELRRVIAYTKRLRYMNHAPQPANIIAAF